jgi:hypothetical protein
MLLPHPTTTVIPYLCQLCIPGKLSADRRVTANRKLFNGPKPAVLHSQCMAVCLSAGELTLIVDERHFNVLWEPEPAPALSPPPVGCYPTAR